MADLTAGQIAVLLKLRDEMTPAMRTAAASASAAANELSTTFSAAAQKAAMRMESLQAEAIKMNAGFTSTDDKAQLFAATMSKVSTTATSSAAALGLPIGQLGALNAVADVAALGMGKLTTAAVGFNAATLGVIGAALAVGAAIGSWLRSVGEGSNVLGLSTKALDENVTKLLGIQTKLGEGQADFQKRIAAINAAAKERQAKADEKDPVFEARAEAVKKATEAAKVAAEAAKQAAAEYRRLVDAYRAANTETGIAAAQQKQIAVILDAVGDAATASAADVTRAVIAMRALGEQGSVAGDQLRASWEKAQGVFLMFPRDVKLPLDKVPDVADAATKAVAQTEVSFESLTEAEEDARTAAEKWLETLNKVSAQVDNVLALVGAIRDLPGAFASATDSASTFDRALGGAQVGAQYGATIGKSIGGMIGGPMGAAIGEAIGKTGGAIIGAVVGIFRKPAWVQIGKDAGAILGFAVSKEFAKTVEATMKELGVGVKVATLLNLDKAISESGRAVSSFGPQILDLFELVAQGGQVGAAAVEQLNEAFTDLVKEADAGSMAASKLMVQMLQLARSTKTATAEMQAFVDSALSAAQEGVKAMIEAGTITTLEDAQAQGYIFAAAFWAAVAEQGIVKAAIAFKDSWDAFKQQLADAQIDPASLSAITAPVDAVMSLLDNEATRNIVVGLDGATQAVKNLGAAGYMTQGAFQGIEQQAGSAFKQLTDAGVAGPVALQAIAPTLAEIQRQSELYGIAIDENTQGLIDQAAAAGIAFPMDPLQQVIKLLEDIVDTIREINGLPVEIRTKTPNNIEVPGAPGGGAGGGDEYNPQGYAGGFYSPELPADMTMRVHKRERVEVTPAGETPARNAQDARGGGVAYSSSPNINVYGATPDQIMDIMMDKLRRNDRSNLERLRLMVQGRVA